MDSHNLSDVIAALTDDQQMEVHDFVMTMMDRGAQRPKTRLRQDWAGGLVGNKPELSALELQRSILI